MATVAGLPMSTQSPPVPRPELRAITFDSWDTLMWEQPGSLKTERLAVWAEEGLATRVGAERREAAHDEAHRAYVAAWEHGEQFRIEEAADLIAEPAGPAEMNSSWPTRSP